MQTEIERFVHLLGREMEKYAAAGTAGDWEKALVRVPKRPVVAFRKKRGKDGKSTSES